MWNGTACVEAPTGYRDRGGYASVKIDRKAYRAHRWAWMQANGPIPDGLWVLHHCDNPPCVNVEHLFLGTVQDNSDDMVAKGRGPLGPRNGAATHPEQLPRGSAHGLAKLTEADVVVIRARASSGEMHTTLARAYGVTPAAVGYIVRRITWRHVV